MKQFILFLFILSLVTSCRDDKTINPEIAQIDIRVNIERFDQIFANTSVSELPKIKKAYPFMFSERFDDSYWAERMNDSIQQMLQSATKEVFNDITVQENEVSLLFKHLKFNYPTFNAPRVITATSLVDYRNKVYVTDTIVLVSLDTYLGTNHEYYEGLQTYIRANMKSEQLVVDLASKYAEQRISQPKRKTLLDEMVYYGKILYFKDVMIPFKSNADKIGYTDAQYDWAKVNEENIWRYFVERELLYDTNSKLPNQFINPAPFSKFYLEEVDNDSPGMIGRYIGWEIVKAFMSNNEISLNELLNTDAESIFNASNYKPQL
jgi:gliding motility-associated lipoprotein GldB